MRSPDRTIAVTTPATIQNVEPSNTTHLLGVKLVRTRCRVIRRLRRNLAAGSVPTGTSPVGAGRSPSQALVQNPSLHRGKPNGGGTLAEPGLACTWNETVWSFVRT